MRYPTRLNRQNPPLPLRRLLGVIAVCLAPGFAFAGPVHLLSTQLAPLPEATIFRSTILKDFYSPVAFAPVDNREVFLEQARRLTVEDSGNLVYGGLEQDLLRLKQAGLLGPADEVWKAVAATEFAPGLVQLGRLGTDRRYFVPWMRATYLMAANRRALAYLPAGASLHRLSYQQLLQWAKNIYEATGDQKLGFPAGPKGLFARFLEGYLYPSFTGSAGTVFERPGADQMWVYLRNLWNYVNPDSFANARMDRALLDGQVWIAWDHTARLATAVREEPDRFVAFPAPVGPKGRAFITVVAGLGIPKGRAGTGATGLISYLTSPRVQALLFDKIGFLPVVRLTNQQDLSRGLRELATAAELQFASADGIPIALHLASPEAEEQLALIYMVAFSRIVLRGLPIQETIGAQEKKLARLLDRYPDLRQSGQDIRPEAGEAVKP